MADFPEDLQKAYEIFAHLCTHHDIALAGVGFRENPLGLFALGNVVERGHKFAQLLRDLAQIVDERTDAGQFIEAPRIDPNKLN